MWLHSFVGGTAATNHPPASFEGTSCWYPKRLLQAAGFRASRRRQWAALPIYSATSEKLRRGPSRVMKCAGRRHLWLPLLSVADRANWNKNGKICLGNADRQSVEPRANQTVRQVWKFRMFALLDTKNLGNNLGKCWVWGSYRKTGWYIIDWMWFWCSNVMEDGGGLFKWHFLVSLLLAD